MSKVSIIVMVVAAIGMIFGLSKQKGGAAWGKPVAVLCAIVALCCAVGHIFTSGGPNMMKVREREMAYQMIGAKKLGMVLAEKHAGANAIIIVEPSAGGPNETTDAMLAGLREGLGSGITIVEEIAPEIPAAAMKQFAQDMGPMEGEGGGEEMLPPLEFWFTAKLFDELAEKNKSKADMIITTIGLPMDLGAMKFWKMKDRPKLALAGGSVYDLKRAIKDGMVVAAVTYNPKAVYDEKAPPSDLDAAFDKRYLLVTSDNIDQIASEHTDIFK